MTWTVEDVGPYVLVKTSGTFDLEDHVAMVSDIVSRDFWRSGRDAFFDHRALTFDGSGYAAMNVAAGTHRGFDERIGAGRAAILMSGLADYGVGRIFHTLTEGVVHADIRIFVEPASAEAWLRAPANPATLEPPR